MVKRRGLVLVLLGVLGVGVFLWVSTQSRIPEKLPAPTWAREMTYVGFSTWPTAERDVAARKEVYTTQASVDSVVAIAEKKLLPEGWTEERGESETVFTLGHPASRRMPNWALMTRQAPWYRLRIQAGHAIVAPHSFVPPHETRPWTAVTYEIGGRTPAIFDRGKFDDRHLGNPIPGTVFIVYAPSR